MRLRGRVKKLEKALQPGESPRWSAGQLYDHLEAAARADAFAAVPGLPEAWAELLRQRQAAAGETPPPHYLPGEQERRRLALWRAWSCPTVDAAACRVLRLIAYGDG